MTDPRTEPLTDAQLDNLELAARASFGEDERSQGLINGVLSLIIEVRSLRHDDAIWDKHSLVQIVTERNELRAELDAIRHAAHMPDDYEHGLPSWINQHLYGKLMEWTDVDGEPIRRSEDIEEMRQLRLQVAQLAEALEVATGITPMELPECVQDMPETEL